MATSIVTARVNRSGGQGGFLCPPGHPNHSMRVETNLHRKRDDRGSMSIEYAATEATPDMIPDDIRAEAVAILANWQNHDRLAIGTREVNLWLRQVFAYFRNCYRGPGEEPECWYADRLTITREPMPRQQSAAYHLIRKYYPDFDEPETDYPAECRMCGHHINAHANGEGGKCTVILHMHPTGDRSPYKPDELCACNEFTQ